MDRFHLLPFSKIKLPVMVFCIIFGISTLNIGNYGYLDDYSNLWNAKYNSLDFFKLCSSQGRPLLGIIGIIIFLPLSNISQLIFIHILSSLCLALLGVIIYQIFHFANQKYNRLKPFTIFWLSVLPLLANSGFLILGAWSSLFPALLGLLLGCYGVLKILKNTKSIAGSFFIAINILIYQPNFILLSLIFFTSQIFLNINLYSQESKANLRSYRLLMCLILIGAVISFLSIQSAKMFGYSSGSRGTITKEYEQKIQWFLDSVLPRVIHFYSPWDSSQYIFISLVGLFFTGATLLYFNSSSKSKFFYILFIMVPLSVAPNILIAENWASSRSLLAPQWLFSIFALLPILILLDKFLVMKSMRLIASLCIVFVVTVNFYEINVVNFKIPQETELKIARDFLTEEECNNLTTVTQSSWTDSLAEKVSYDEFGIPSTTQPWVPIPLSKFLCLERGVKVDSIVLAPRDEVKTSAGNVDFGKLLEIYKNSRR